METGPWPHLDRRQERGVVWGGRHRLLLEVPANFLELRYGEVRRTPIRRSSQNSYSTQFVNKGKKGRGLEASALLGPNQCLYVAGIRQAPFLQAAEPLLRDDGLTGWIKRPPEVVKI